MNKYIFFLLAFLYGSVSFAQKTTDPELTKRLNAYLRLTRESKFNELMDYTHPKIFTIMPREQLVEIMEKSFDNDQMTIGIDSIGTTTISPDFVLKTARYKKIGYWMVISVVFKDTTVTSDESFVARATSSFEKGFPGAKVYFNPNTKHFEIRATSLMIAIKDSPAKPWYFLGYQRDEALLNKLYPKEVIAHFKLL
jgi:hypothetical protein